MRLLLLALALTGCATGTRCDTVAVIPHEFVVLYCASSGARHGIVVVRWADLVGPWPVQP